ncbi:MAG: M56 family metallopeptidase [Acidobacteriaceae bacterium]
MSTVFAESVGNHLWQSTLFALCAAGLAFMLRGIPARTRYWIWFVASLKFLVPFSALFALGGSLASIHGTKGDLQPAPYYSLDVVSQPFTFTPIGLSNSGKTTLLAPGEQSVHLFSIGAAIWAAGSLILLCCWIIHWRRMAVDLRNARPATKGFEFSVLQRVQALHNMRRPIAIAISDTSLEPGIFGIWRPTLVWPRGISKRLNEAHIEGIIAHEIAHVQRRDNLTAALHMLVQAIFWFHPIAWWLQRRLLEERERACDEAVMRLGGAPEVYAESVLRACRFSVGSAGSFASGISGSDLAQRVRRIVSGRPVPCLTRTHKMLLIGLTALAVLSPILFGFADVPRVSAALLQNSGSKPEFSFEVATVKPSSGQEPNRGTITSPGRFRAENVSVKDVIMFAYDIRSGSQISGYPDWVNSIEYDIEAKADETTTAALDKLPPDQRGRQVKLMVQALLADRFHLRVSYQTREIPVYALVIAKGGPKLMKSTGPLSLAGGGTRSGIMESKSGEVHGINSSLDEFAAAAPDLMPEIGDRVVVNKTGLTGNYDWTLRWTPEATSGVNGGTLPPPGSDDFAPSLFTALEEQLGMKLESQKGSVETLVVDSIDRPTAN